MTVDHIVEKLKERGYKHTDKREKMIRIFDREKRYLSAKELLAFMQKDFPGLSFDTVYRNLSLFEELSILESTDLNGERIYRLYCSTTTDHHHHLICLSCGKSRLIEMCPLDSLTEKLDEFLITDHKFELYGYCVKCQ